MSGARPLVLLRGGGDVASGVAARLHRTGFAVVVTEVAMPMAVRRLVSLAEAVYSGEVVVEDLHAQRVDDLASVDRVLATGSIPVLVDPTADSRHTLEPVALVDGRMIKRASELGLDAAPFVVGLGPGFTVGIDCHAIVETNRGHHLGRVIWRGRAEEDTGVPESLSGHDVDRVLRAPISGPFEGLVPLASLVGKGDVLATVGGVTLHAPFGGALRGLLHSGLHVEAGAKVGDVDPRGDPGYCIQFSDKALAVGGGVLEALLSQPEIRARLRG